MALGWDHLVGALVEQGRLVRPVTQDVVLEKTHHYLTYREDKADDEALSRFREWGLSECQTT